MIKKPLLYLLILGTYLDAQTPVKFWENQTIEEKISFVNGAFAAISKIKNHHQIEVQKQYVHDNNWIEPYYIKRFYDITDEYLCSEIGYNLKKNKNWKKSKYSSWIKMYSSKEYQSVAKDNIKYLDHLYKTNKKKNIKSLITIFNLASAKIF